MSGNTCSNEYGEKNCQICQVDFALKNLIKKIVKIVKPLTFTWFHGILLNLQ